MTSTRRESGLLLHPTSLPGPEAVGTLGDAAFAFIDFLADAGQRVWQVLPLGPTDVGNSPYMATSAFAGNPLLIDLEDVFAHGGLDASELTGRVESSAQVDFGRVLAEKPAQLRHAWEHFAARGGLHDERFRAFREEERAWLDDFALFVALSERFGTALWTSWPHPLRDRDASAIAAARVELADRIHSVQFEQFTFRRQWEAVRRHADSRGVELVGDIPIFVSLGSSDVWCNREIFDLDSEGNPNFVAGVPPDYFSETGQLWGNPLYRWDVLQSRGFDWWLARFASCFELVHRARIDHFRGFDAFWQVPANAPDARSGWWVVGPGRALFDALIARFGTAPIIAEDLGTITDGVTRLREAFGFPGMRVMHFGFGDDLHNPHRLSNHEENAVVYTGTHDNDTTAGWYASLDEQAKHEVREAIGSSGEHIAHDLMNAVWGSRARLAIAPVQDVLELGADARMNTPGLATGNWGWRLLASQLTPAHAAWLSDLSARHHRSR